MPIYEYHCHQCHKVSEHLQKINDPAPHTCPHCGKEGQLSKQLSQAAFHLKGGGWYADAYSSKKPEGKSKPESSTPETKPESPKTETSKPAKSE
jgi:putative FmdB family regulatory protein